MADTTALSVAVAAISLSADKPFRRVAIEGKGHGVVAEREIQAGECVLSSTPDIAVLYTDFVRNTCARCYVGYTAAATLCSLCCSFQLCADCDEKEGGALRRWHAEHECKQFAAIPAAMRQGDTDYLRFVLRYFGILAHGALPPLHSPAHEGGALQLFERLCSNMEMQPPEFVVWTKNVAGLFAAHVPFPEAVNVDQLAELFAKIKMNTLGFPFTADGETLLGWCLHTEAAALNHSCSPNCHVAPNGDGDERSHLRIVTTGTVAKDEELTISYVDLLADDMKDGASRRAKLLDSYLFECTCTRCLAEKAATAIA